MKKRQQRTKTAKPAKPRRTKSSNGQLNSPAAREFAAIVKNPTRFLQGQ
jgi:hypothetical protein